MSRRAPDPAAERAARNAQTIKSLLKLEGNKACADCKKNKRMLRHGWPSSFIIEGPQTNTNARPKMGQLEPGHIYLHSLLRYTPRNGDTHKQS